jgi:hypothetical protein
VVDRHGTKSNTAAPIFPSVAGNESLANAVVRLRHKLQEPTDDAEFERLTRWLFLPEITACARLCVVCDAVVVVAFLNRGGVSLTAS